MHNKVLQVQMDELNISFTRRKGVNMLNLDDRYYYVLHIQSCVLRPFCIGWGGENAIQGGMGVLYITWI